MRAQGEAEIAIEQGETRYEGVTWTTPRQIASNQLIPLPEPARRGLINLANESSPPPTRLSPRPLNSTPAISPDQTDPVTSASRAFRRVPQITHPHDPAPRGPRR